MAAARGVSDPASFARWIDWGARTLAARSTTPRLDAQVLMAALAGLPRSVVMAYPERTLSAAQIDTFRAQVRRRATGVPLAHLTGRREFYSLDLRVSADTLVPRPETELLVELLLERVAPEEPARILDAGTGSGAIALAIKSQRPNARVAGLDASEAALAVAAENAERLGLDVQWLRSNWFRALSDLRFDFIVSNPPYVEAADRRLTAGDLRHEPRLALDGGLEGLDSLRAVITGAPRVLAPSGTLLVEHGHDQAGAVSQMLEDSGFRHVQIFKDLAHSERVTLGSLE